MAVMDASKFRMNTILRSCVLDADSHSDAQSDADERSHVPKFPRSDKNDNVPRAFFLGDHI